MYLGEGSTLYLQMLKAFTIIFFVLTVLNVPLFLVYYENSKSSFLRDFHGFFSTFSLASLAESSQGCGYATLDVAQYTDSCRCVSILYDLNFCRMPVEWPVHQDMNSIHSMRKILRIQSN